MSHSKPVISTPERSALEPLWYLEGFVDQSRSLRRVPIQPRPFRIGRHPSQELTLSSESVSHEHAEIYEVTGLLRIRDLDSTNGTFVNRKPVDSDIVLVEGDVLHFADLEFVLARTSPQEFENFIGRTDEVEVDLPDSLVGQVRRLREVIDRRELGAVFQPVVSLADHSVLGYEMLGRASAEGLPAGAHDLLDIASSIGSEVELSRLFRLLNVEACRRLPGSPIVFMNTHPAELEGDGLPEAMRELRDYLPRTEIVLEIHEVAITESDTVSRLKTELAELKIGLAFDDFGTGQARLLDVVEVPPDYLKFDISLIRDIDRLPSKQQMLRSLVAMVRELGIVPTAEGVETEEEERVCRDIGFEYAQGYLLGRPSTVDDLLLTR